MKRESELLAAEACAALEEAITVLAELVLSDGGDPTADGSFQRIMDDAPHAERIEALLGIAAAQLSNIASRDAREPADGIVLDRPRVMRMLSEMVGTLLIARTVSRARPHLADEILQAS